MIIESRKAPSGFLYLYHCNRNRQIEFRLSIVVIKTKVDTSLVLILVLFLFSPRLCHHILFTVLHIPYFYYVSHTLDNLSLYFLNAVWYNDYRKSKRLKSLFAAGNSAEQKAQSGFFVSISLQRKSTNFLNFDFRLSL